MKRRPLLGLFRLGVGVLGLSAITTQLIATLQTGTSIINFFSFFTIQSNLLTALLLVAIGSCMLAGIQKNIGYLRGATTLYMTTTGVIYFLLLSNDPNTLLIPWVNTTLHYIIPAIVFLDWILFPPMTALSFKKALIWLAYPLAYLGYSLIRGSVVGWYPYPFINPDMKGWGSVITTSIVILIAATILVWFLTLTSKRRQIV